MVTASGAADLTVATFNTESDDDTQPDKIAEHISKIGPFDILAVQEVESVDALKLYADTAASILGGRWRFVVSESGTYADPKRKPDFLGIVYPTEVFRQLATTELHVVRSEADGTPYGAPDWSLRGALVLRLQHMKSGKEFQIATVHLKCCEEPDIRAHQTGLLAKEIIRTGLPTLLLGDTNIPIEPGAEGATGDHAEAFLNLTTGANLSWVKPKNPVKTQCNPKFNSMLDQVFAPSPLPTGSAVDIKFPEEAYCDLDAQGYADHRPLIATIPGFFADPTVEIMTPVVLKRNSTDEETAEYNLQKNGRPGDSVK